MILEYTRLRYYRDNITVTNARNAQFLKKGNDDHRESFKFAPRKHAIGVLIKIYTSAICEMEFNTREQELYWMKYKLRQRVPHIKAVEVDKLTRKLFDASVLLLCLVVDFIDQYKKRWVNLSALRVSLVGYCIPSINVTHSLWLKGITDGAHFITILKFGLSANSTVRYIRTTRRYSDRFRSRSKSDAVVDGSGASKPSLGNARGMTLCSVWRSRINLSWEWPVAKYRKRHIPISMKLWAYRMTRPLIM